MVLSFFRKGEPSIDQISRRVVTMLGEARHSFDLATSTLISGADPKAVEADIYATDARINRAEQELRGELVVHVSVQGAEDIGIVLAYTLLIKKVERIGDQAKNIFDLAQEGVSLANADDIDELQRFRRDISAMFGETAALLAQPDEAKVRDFVDRSDALRHECEDHIRAFMHSEKPGSYAVPRAVLYRYWKRIVANLGGVITTATEPIQRLDYLDGGTTDGDD